MGVVYGLYFFFQAEDGIRDGHVTGVQTCALPISQRGWVGMTFPQQYGGRGYGLLERFVLAEELLCRGAPVSAHWIADRQSGPLILRYGTEAQRDFYLPRIVRGEAFFCIGMSEPNAGSDLASVRSRAEPTAQGWRLNGQKIWTTNAQDRKSVV